MPARVTFLLGRSGSGKTRRLHRCIKEALDKGRRVVVIVPEQFTFETERQLASELGGLMDIEVYSFSSLAEKTLEGSYLGFLSRQGRRMAVRKTITEQGSKLRIFARVKDRPGFSERLCELFTACKRYEVAPGDLLDGAEKAGEDSLLANKLTELALLYGETESYISGRYMDSEDMFAALIQNLPSSPIAGAEVVIDDFDLLTDQLYHLMAAAHGPQGGKGRQAFCAQAQGLCPPLRGGAGKRLRHKGHTAAGRQPEAAARPRPCPS